MRFFNIRAFSKKKIILFVIFLLMINYFSIFSYPVVDNFDKMKLQSPFTENILLNTGTGSYLYGIYIFIISSLMYADCFVIDKITGLENIISTKCNYKNYVKKSIGYNFFIAGIFSILPLLINLLFWLSLRANVPLVYFNTMNIGTNTLFSDIFMKSKLLFFILNFFKIFLLGGIIGTFALYLNTKFKNRFLGLILPFIIDILIGLLSSILLKNAGVSFYILAIDSIKPDITSLLVVFVFLIPSLVFFNKFLKNEDKL